MASLSIGQLLSCSICILKFAKEWSNRAAKHGNQVSPVSTFLTAKWDTHTIVNSRAVEGVVSFRSFRLRVGRARRDSRATFANTSPLVYRMRKEGSIVQLIKAFTQVLLFSQKLIFCSLMLFIFIFKILCKSKLITKTNNICAVVSTVLTLMNALAFVSKPRVVCLLDSGPRGTISLSFSKQLRKWARLQEVILWISNFVWLTN